MEAGDTDRVIGDDTGVGINDFRLTFCALGAFGIFGIVPVLLFFGGLCGGAVGGLFLFLWGLTSVLRAPSSLKKSVREGLGLWLRPSSCRFASGAPLPPICTAGAVSTAKYSVMSISGAPLSSTRSFACASSLERAQLLGSMVCRLDPSAKFLVASGVSTEFISPESSEGVGGGAEGDGAPVCPQAPVPLPVAGPTLGAETVVLTAFMAQSRPGTVGNVLPSALAKSLKCLSMVDSRRCCWVRGGACGTPSSKVEAAPVVAAPVEAAPVEAAPAAGDPWLWMGNVTGSSRLGVRREFRLATSRSVRERSVVVVVLVVCLGGGGQSLALIRGGGATL
jgi:hypothetical protein